MGGKVVGVAVDLLEFLLTSPNLFHSLPLSQKQEIVSKRPTPLNIDIVSYEDEGEIRFNTEWYSTYDWLTGSLHRKKLYCFVCLVIGQSTTISDIFSSLSHFHKKAHFHEISKQHIQYSECFVRILKYNQKQNLIEEVIANDVYKTSKKIVKKLVRFLFLSNRIRYMELTSCSSNTFERSLNFMAYNDISFPTNWEAIFKNITLKEAQQELFEFLHEGVKDFIRREMGQCEFVSVQVDDMSEYTCKPTFSIIFRYLVNHQINERFAGFFEMSEDHSPEYFGENIMNFIREWGVENKLVSITNDSATTKVLSYKLQERNILTLHNANYNLNLALLKVAFNHSDVREFAGSVTIIASFFSETKREMRLKSEGFSIPKEFTEPGASLETYIWIIKTKFSQLSACIAYILESGNWDLETTSTAKFIVDIMQNDVFVYLLCLFSKIFIISDHISCVIRLVSFKDLKMCTDEIEQFNANLKDIVSPSYLRKIHGESIKMREGTNQQLTQVILNKLTEDIIRSILEEMESRFSDHSKLEYFQILDERKFEAFSKSFPYKTIVDLVSYYYSAFDQERLETELSVIYDDESKRIPTRDLLSQLVDNGLTTVYPQLVKLISLFLTLPVYVAEESAEKRTYEKTKKFAKFYNTLELFSTQGVLIINDDVVDKLLNDEIFMDGFVESYTQRSKYFKTIN